MSYADRHQRHAVAILAGAADGDPVVGVGQRLAERVDLHPGRMAALDFLLQRRAEAGNRLAAVVRAAVAAAGVPELDAEAAQVVALVRRLVVEAPQVDVLAADAAIVARRPAGQRLHPADVIEADLLAQVAADDVRAVADAVRIRGRLRVEQDARRVDAAGADDHDLAQHLVLGAGLAVEVLDAARLALVVDQHARDDRVRPDLELAGLQRERDQVIGGAEERRRVAAGAAAAAVVAGREAARRLGHVGAAAGDDVDAERLGALLQQPFAAARRRRRLQELAARQRLGVVVTAADADHLLDLVVVGRDVGVRDRPGDLPAVAGRGLEIHLRQAQADAAPDVGLAAQAPHPRQVEVLALGDLVGLLLRVQVERLRRLALGPALARLPRADVRPELAALELVAGVQHQHLDALLRQVPRGHPAGRAAADDDDGVDLRDS